MKRLLSAKPLLAAAVALGAMAAIPAAHARPDVVISIGLHAPFGYVQPAPVYVQPQPVYTQPQFVYAQPQFVHGPQRSYDRRGAWGDRDRDGIPNAYDRDNRFRDGRSWQHNRAWGDADRDGVPNRYDRAPHNPYRR